VTCEALKTISGEDLAIVRYDNIKIGADAVLGAEGNAWPAIEAVLRTANIGRCATMCGLSRKALDLTLDYARERMAFGHPIGAFQSIQHRCADMLMDVEGSRFLTYQAAWKLASGQSAVREVAIAKAWVSAAARRVMHSAHQAHGAIGFSEDHILHLYTKMTRACEFAFGDADYHYNELVKLSS
jgi:alkylation response protein AidB-like acyl-CoA dehydrogenase